MAFDLIFSFPFQSFYDAEAIVIGHKEGHGRNAGVTGALKCKMASGKVHTFVHFELRD